MKIALFGNAMKRMTLGEVSHVLEFMELRQVEVYLSQELRQEMNLRDYPPFPDEEKAWKEKAPWSSRKPRPPRGA